MLQTEPPLVSPSFRAESSGPHRGEYSKLRLQANGLRLSLQTAAEHCDSPHERKRLRLLADVARKLHECLAPARAGVR
jgi:hypothetical protein